IVCRSLFRCNRAHRPGLVRPDVVAARIGPELTVGVRRHRTHGKQLIQRRAMARGADRLSMAEYERLEPGPAVPARVLVYRHVSRIPVLSGRVKVGQPGGWPGSPLAQRQEYG